VEMQKTMGGQTPGFFYFDNPGRKFPVKTAWNQVWDDTIFIAFFWGANDFSPLWDKINDGTDSVTGNQRRELISNLSAEIALIHWGFMGIHPLAWIHWFIDLSTADYDLETRHLDPISRSCNSDGIGLGTLISQICKGIPTSS
jgi:hypothetical protein